MRYDISGQREPAFATRRTAIVWPAGMSLPARIMGSEGGTATVDNGEAGQMKDHNGVLIMQRALLAGTLGLAMARKAAAILEGDPGQGAPFTSASGVAVPQAPVASPECQPSCAPQHPAGVPRTQEGAVLRAILDAANECLGHFDDRPPGERWCDTLFHLLDLAAFAAELDLGAQ